LSCELGESCSCGFVNTGADFSEVWKKRKAAINDDMWCESCKVHALDLENFTHDHVNSGLKKEIFDKSNYHKIIDEIICARDECLKEGRC